MPLPTSGSISYGDIASEIEAKYSITLADKKWSTMRSACNINHFHPDYSGGATSISQIKKVSQFRGFPSTTYYNIAFGQCRTVTTTTNPGDMLVATIQLRKQTDNAIIGTATSYNEVGASPSNSGVTNFTDSGLIVAGMTGIPALSLNSTIEVEFMIDHNYMKTVIVPPYYVRVSITKNGGAVNITDGAFVNNPQEEVGYGKGSDLYSFLPPTLALAYTDSIYGANQVKPPSGRPYFGRSIGTGAYYDFYFDDFD